MSTLEELIRQSQLANPDAFAKFGDSAFVNLDPSIQVAANTNIQQNAQTIRSIFPSGTSGLNDFIRQSSANISNLFKLGSSTTQRAEENKLAFQGLNTLSDALNKQISLREEQRAADNNAFSQFAADVSQKLEQLGQATKDSDGGAGFELPIIGAIGTTGLIIGGLALVLILRK